MKAFTVALESLGKTRFRSATFPRLQAWWNEYFNDSTGVGDEGESDARGPWNEGGDWKIVEPPELERRFETHRGKTVATTNKHVGEESGKRRVKKVGVTIND